MRNSDPDYIWIHLFVSGLYLIIGLHVWINPPTDMDKPSNLPTATNIKLNIDVWTEFHKYVGKIMAIISSILLLLLIISFNQIIPVEQLPSSKLEGLNIVLLLITSPFIIFTSLIMTETHMAKTFDKKGNRKEKSI